MKKIILVTTLICSLAGLSSYGQGNFIFGTGAGYVWNPLTQTRGGAYNVSFAYDNTLGRTPLVQTTTGLLSTRTNSVEQFSVNPWTSIMSDPNFIVAVNTNGNSVVVGTLSGTGGVVYNLGGNFAVQGTSAAGGQANVYMFAWDNAYATPALASAAGASVGWSKPFVYSYAANPGAAGGNFSAAAVTAGVGAQFGVSPIPEPATFALAGLGMAAMLVARRRK